MFKVMVIMRLIYKTILRELVFNAIDNPDSEIDDFVLKLLDKIFDYNGE
ncbi:hypothetical protein LCGC14_2256260 [marine sediment metagenome]|uniref:Uncharacterized protein n=1 Tax=marine sediment metagenome TaxID=412755 RepID=A0A0F9D1G5_9ZZZZ